MVAKAKTDHDRFREVVETVPLESLVPATINDAVYKPVSLDDPEVIRLADSIRELGLLDPIVITNDNVILSGHRRAHACMLANLEVVRVIRRPFTSGHPDFVRLLVEHNRQRVKTLDEQLREEFATSCIDEEEVYAELAQYRKDHARVHVETIDIRGKKSRSAISKARLPFLEATQRVISGLKEFWPLSVRQVHYNLLNDPPLMHASKPGSTYRNNLKCYKALIDLLTQARLGGHISFTAIGDETRPVAWWNIYDNPAPFLKREIEEFMVGYWRNLLQSQPNFVVLVGEKNTVEPILRPVAMDYTIPLIIGRGYSSIPPRYEIAQRFKKSGKERLVLLVASDHDPEGDDIPHSLARSIRDDFGIRHVDAIKVGLTHEQVVSLRLTPNATAKEKSSRRKEFVRKYGEAVYELEAVPPARLQDFARSAIESVLDMKLFRAEQDREKTDAAEINSHRQRVRRILEAGNR